MNQCYYAMPDLRHANMKAWMVSSKCEIMTDTRYSELLLILAS